MTFFQTASLADFVKILTKASFAERSAIAKIEQGKNLSRDDIEALKDFNRASYQRNHKHAA